MNPAIPGTGEPASSERVARLTAECARDLEETAAAYPDLYAGFGSPGLYRRVATAVALGAPWHTAGELRLPCRAALWYFALDWLMDRMATSRSQVDEVVAGCLATADGAEPRTPLSRFLADIRRDLATVPAFARSGRAWREELEQALAAMAREWGWKTAPGTGPTLEDYLSNAHNFGSTWVNVSYWIFTDDPDDRPRAVDVLDELRQASDAVQRTLRLANDLATEERDHSWGDLNALMIVDRAAVHERISALYRESCEILRALEAVCPRQADYLRRQLEFSLAFYGGGSDYWDWR
ncbi:terpene synthase family protein [Actinoallomurus sp. CA-150999]|uniref:terpene synthase family protein n=1 Tax=Actinoallomurus sp. CA-150999 TaxID=3239887 RepID=UPI003D8F0AE9